MCKAVCIVLQYRTGGSGKTCSLRKLSHNNHVTAISTFRAKYVTLTNGTLLNDFLPHMTSDFHKELKFLMDLGRDVITFCRRVLTECVYCNNMTLIRFSVESWRKDTQTHKYAHTIQT